VWLAHKENTSKKASTLAQRRGKDMQRMAAQAASENSNRRLYPRQPIDRYRRSPSWRELGCSEVNDWSSARLGKKIYDIIGSILVPRKTLCHFSPERQPLGAEF
jgi:hypothetical protein